LKKKKNNYYGISGTGREDIFRRGQQERISEPARAGTGRNILSEKASRSPLKLTYLSVPPDLLHAPAG